MQESRERSRHAGLRSGTLILALLAVSAAGAAQETPAAATPPASAHAAPAHLSAAPPAGDSRARLAWSRAEATRLRARVAAHPRDALARVMLGALAVVVTSDMERALARGERDTATELRALLADKLADAPVWLEYLGHHGAGGADFALGVAALHGIFGPRDSETACAQFASALDKGFADATYRLSGCIAAQDPARSTVLLRRAAAAGNPEAREDLGRRCLESTPRDFDCAAAAFEAAAAAGRAPAKSLLGWMNAQGLGMASNPARALRLYREAAAAGDLSALNNLGELFETGRGAPVDLVRAAGYYRQAAQAGFAPAQFNLGRMYAAGTGVARDSGEARKWLQAALAAGIQPAQKLLDWLAAQATRGEPAPGGVSR